MLFSLVCRQFGILYCFDFILFFFEYNQITYNIFVCFYSILFFKILKKKNGLKLWSSFCIVHMEKRGSMSAYLRLLLDDTCCVILKGQVQSPATLPTPKVPSPLTHREGGGRNQESYKTMNSVSHHICSSSFKFSTPLIETPLNNKSVLDTMACMLVNLINHIVPNKNSLGRVEIGPTRP